jgi:hypothetical protein
VTSYGDGPVGQPQDLSVPPHGEVLHEVRARVGVPLVPMTRMAPVPLKPVPFSVSGMLPTLTPPSTVITAPADTTTLEAPATALLFFTPSTPSRARSKTPTRRSFA